MAIGWYIYIKSHSFPSYPKYVTKLHPMLLWGVWIHILIEITPKSTLTLSGSMYQCPIYGLNRFIWKLLMLDKNTLNLIIVYIQMIIVIIK